MEDQYPRITQAQFDIWVDNPVTKTYLQCLNWSAEQCREVVGNGSLVEMDNNDKSMNNISGMLGKAHGYDAAAIPLSLINSHQMLEIPEEEETE